MDKALLPAVLALFGTLVAGFLSSFLSEHHRRFRDKQALAGALAGEIGSYREGWPIFETTFPTLIDIVKSGERVEVPKIDKPTDRVFDSCVAQIGMLGPELAEDLAYVYNNLNAFRAMFFSIASQEATPQQQYAMLESAWACLNRAKNRGKDLPERLKMYAKRRYALQTLPLLFSGLIVVALLVGAYLVGATTIKDEPEIGLTTPMDLRAGSFCDIARPTFK